MFYDGAGGHALGAEGLIVAEADAALDPHRARVHLEKHAHVTTILQRFSRRLNDLHADIDH
jgi:hypothetical protein